MALGASRCRPLRAGSGRTTEPGAKEEAQRAHACVRHRHPRRRQEHVHQMADPVLHRLSGPHLPFAVFKRSFELRSFSDVSRRQNEVTRKPTFDGCPKRNTGIMFQNGIGNCMSGALRKRLKTQTAFKHKSERRSAPTPARKTRFKQNCVRTVFKEKRRHHVSKRHRELYV